MTKPPFQFQYQQIASELKSQILQGDIASDGRLPSERQLGLRFQVQRNTIRQALAQLEREGHIATEDRKGSFVRVPSTPRTPKEFLVNLHYGSGPNLTSLVEGLSDALDQAGCRLSRRHTDPTSDTSLDLIPDVDEIPSTIAGMVVWPHYPIDSEKLAKLSRRLPLVLVDRRAPGVNADCIRFDDMAGGEMVTEHLLSQGHRRIAFLTDEVFAETVQSRWHGYVLAHERRRIQVEPRLSLLFQEFDTARFNHTMRYVLADSATSPTAIVCSNDVVAFTLLRFLHEEGLRVPEDIAITGYGNGIPDYAEAMTLTTVDQPFYEAGRMAGRILLERAGQSAAARSHSPYDIAIPVSLVVRGSSVT